MDSLLLDDIPEEDRYKIGGPDVVRLQEDKLIEKRKKERQLKRSQMEKKRFFSQTQPNPVEERSLSRDERKIKMAMQMFELQEKKKKEIRSADEDAEQKARGRESDEQASNGHGKSKLKGTGRTSYDGLHPPTKRIVAHAAHFAGSPCATPRLLDEDDHCEEINNTHLNKKHLLEPDTSLLKYLRHYELALLPARTHALDRLTDKLAQRLLLDKEVSCQKANELRNENKTADNLISLCDKLNGIELFQPITSILQQIKRT